MGRILSIEERIRKTYYFSRLGSLVFHNHPALAVGSMLSDYFISVALISRVAISLEI